MQQSELKSSHYRFGCGGGLRGYSPLKNLQAGESPLHLWIIDFWVYGFLDHHSLACEFPVSALSASSLRSAPGGIVAATERLFRVVQALSPCAAQGSCSPLDPKQGSHPAPVASRFFYRLTPSCIWHACLCSNCQRWYIARYCLQ